MTSVYIAIGSNVGDRINNLKQALTLLDGITVIEHCSPIYETPPMYMLDQEAFLNMVIGGDTACKPQLLLRKLKDIEAEIGRVMSKERYGPRIIDLDILFFGDAVINVDGLTIPHPRLSEREFVLRPLADIAPSFQHPLLGKSINEILIDLQSGTTAKLFQLDV